jgi:hypothetical protein
MPNDYQPLPVDSDTNEISKSLEHGGFVALKQDSGEYSYAYGPSGAILLVKKSEIIISKHILQD